jgi:hypothetical protein
MAGPIDAGPTILGKEIMSVERRRQVSAGGLRTFLAIADLWALNEDQRRSILGFPPRSTYHGWVAKAREHQSLTLDFDVLIRISLILGIYKNLRILYATEQDGVEWLKDANKATVFNGKAPIELLTSGHQDAMWATRRFLDGARGGLYLAPNEVDRDFKKYKSSDLVWS